MQSMNLISDHCQVLPDHDRGVIFALDISKDTISHRICRPGKASNPIVVSQDMAGFVKIEKEMEQYKQHGYEVWVGYEPTGAYSCCIFEYLSANGWKVVQINPKHTSKYNDIREGVPGKTDSRDPLGIAGLIFQGCYRTPLHLTGIYAQLRVASAQWATLTCESTRLRNQLHSMIELWFPELREVFADALSKSARAVMRRYDGPQAVAAAGRKKLGHLLGKASRNKTTCRAQALVEAAGRSRAMQSGQRARHRSLLQHLSRLELIEEQREDVRADMVQMLGELPESARLMSVKGIGVVICANILGECGNIGDYSAKQLEKLVGLNLYECSSGKNKGKRRISKCGRSSVRYALCLAATRMTGKGGIYHDVAEEMRARGKKFGEIRVAVARKLLRLLHALVRRDENFELERFVTRRWTGDGLTAHQGRRCQQAAA